MIKANFDKYMRELNLLEKQNKTKEELEQEKQKALENAQKIVELDKARKAKKGDD